MMLDGQSSIFQLKIAIIIKQPIRSIMKYIMDNIAEKTPRAGNIWTPLRPAAKFGHTEICD